MDTGRNILNSDKVKALREIIEQEEAGQVYVIPARGNCKTAAMKAALERATEQAQQIKQHLTETRLTPSTKELLEGVRLPEMPKPSKATREAYEGIMREAEYHETIRRIEQEPTRMTDEAIRRLLTERYPGTPIEAFCSSFIPGGFRLTAPDGAAFDFVYTTHGPSTVDGATTMTMELTVTEIKTGGEQE